jgi:hypothetical protein
MVINTFQFYSSLSIGNWRLSKFKSEAIFIALLVCPVVCDFVDVQQKFWWQGYIYNKLALVSGE